MLSRIWNQVNFWRQDTPLPVSTNTKPVYQQWHHFCQGHWTPTHEKGAPSGGYKHRWETALHLVSWNVDSGAPFPGPRIIALFDTIKSLERVDVIFLQEVSRTALKTLLADPWVQQHYILSDVDNSKFRNQSFITVTLISKLCLSQNSLALGSVWRLALPSRFERDALCCDLLLNQSGKITRIRLVNVHLDSLPIKPSRRPEQLSIVASYLRTASYGLVAGDFNPVLPEDEEIVEINGLVDAWQQLHPEDPGFTWGVEGDMPFPPGRLDKVAHYGLTPSSMRILATGSREFSANEETEFSDHHGLYFVFSWSKNAPAN
ncbi:hypothetical protein BS50DRAFT_388456 [Corynespora cassiicola Philippines]|uniref:Endonuclease/exonuclease/phosphatase domain-containing protein n=1 Tax=Corynespora cassiicola Philippines TaxID=1448308 RepID=A0A2T2NPC0_CORCC|nr:hypothetical protein BS50DRAFT_388456 [Corynespora cassiicola Philippines]